MTNVYLLSPFLQKMARTVKHTEFAARLLKKWIHCNGITGRLKKQRTGFTIDQ